MSALFGAIIAIGRCAVWQDPLESAQVLAGLVTYPPDNPFYIYHVKIWTLITQILAVILSAGVSDLATSLFLEGLVGALSFAGVYLIVYSVSEKPLEALLVPLFMYSLTLVGASGAYPIALLGSVSSYGIIGLSYMLLVFGLLGTGRYRIGALLVGLAPAVHPGLGTFCLLIAIITVFANLRELRPHRSKLLCFFALGAAITLASLGWNLHLASHLLKFDLSLRRNYLEAFIRNFDYHRTAGGWAQSCVLFGIMLAALSVFAARLKNVPLGAKIVFSSVIASVLATLALVVLSSYIPPLFFLKVLIPWRFINYANLCLLPISFGILVADYAATPRLRSLIFASAMIFSFSMRLLGLDGENILYFSIIVALWSIIALRLPDLPEKPFAALTRWQDLLILSVFALCFFRFVVPGAITLATRNVVLRNWTNSEILRTASTRPGVLVTAGSMRQIQLTTRRPVLIDSGSLDIFTLVPETGPIFNELLKEVYGLDIMVKPPENAVYQAGLTYAHKPLWEQRTPEEWENIRGKFGVTDVLTPDTWTLKLPLVIKGSGMNLYSIGQVGEKR
jgi:hypothetical protein